MGDHQTFWCHECDMSVSLVPCSAQETLLCPHCFSDLLELMDSSSSSSSSFSDHQHNSQDNFLLNSPFLHRLIHHLSTHPINHDDRLPSPTAAVPPSSLPASKASVDAIPTLKITSSMLDLDPLLLCAVCKDPFLHSVDAKQLPCNHLYHPHCILPWLSSHSSCPLCRFQLPTDTHQPHLRHQNQNTPLPFDDDDDQYDWFMEYGSHGGSLRLSYIAASGRQMANPGEMAAAASPNVNTNANADSSFNGSFSFHSHCRNFYQLQCLVWIAFFVCCSY